MSTQNLPVCSLHAIPQYIILVSDLHPAVLSVRERDEGIGGQRGEGEREKGERSVKREERKE